MDWVVMSDLIKRIPEMKRDAEQGRRSMLDVAERLAALNDAILKGKIEGADAIRRVETLRMELILLHLLTAYKLHEIANLMKIVEAM